MKNNCLTGLILFLIVLLQGQCVAHDASTETIDFVEKRGGYVPLDTHFKDESGKEVTLRDLMRGRPALLTLIYYHCADACNPLLNNLASALANLKLDPKKYQVITASISADEGPDAAAKKKKNIMNTLPKTFPGDSWRFLSGDEKGIKELADSIGFSFRKDEDGDEYVHPLGVVFLAADGKITRYLHGTYFLPFDLEMGFLEASKGKVGSPLVRTFSVCYGYDPASGKYILNIARISGVSTIIFAALFLAFLFRKKKERKKESSDMN
jgi:protein SCO1